MKSTTMILATIVLICPACDDPEQAMSEPQTFRPCIADWELVEEAKVPCHMDVDKHTLYREIEAKGVDVYIDGNGCFVGKRYHKVDLGNNKCTWNIPTQTCANTLYWSLTKTVMPQSVYDTDACPYPRLWEEQGTGGGVGGGGGGQQQN